MIKNVKMFVADHIWIILLILVKVIFYYVLIDLSPISGMIGLFSFGYMFILFYGCYISKYKYSYFVFMCIYFSITLLMFCDTIYFNYFNQLTSINQLWQMNNLVVVDESVKFATPPISILLFFDIPLVTNYLKREKDNLHKKPYYNSKISMKPVVLYSAMFLFIIIFAINPVKANIFTKVNHTEFFTYHLKDVIVNVFEDVTEVEKPLNEVVSNIGDNVKIEQDEILSGIAEGKNLIVIQLESVQNFVINREYNGQEITPYINELLNKDTIYFDHYFQSIGKGNTADSEFVSQNSLYPVIKGEAYRLYEENTFKGLPWLLRDKGYNNLVFHGYKGEFWNRDKAYVNQGWDDYISMEDFDVTEKIGFGLSDKELFRQTTDYLETVEHPFYGFVITLSSHHPFVLPEEYDDFKLKETDTDTVFGNYIKSVNYADEAIGEFIESLKQKGLYEDTMFVIYGDHHGLNAKDDLINEQVSDFLGYNYDYDQMLRIPLIIHIPNSGASKTVSTVGGQIDMMPTVANLMNLEVDQPFVFGRDLINAKEGGFVASLTYMQKGSFVKDGVIFEISRDGLFENSRAWDIDTGEDISIEGLEEDYKRAVELLDESKRVLDNDLLNNYDQEDNKSN
ncbi:MAG: LTA synthase family protein [Eubacteriales bacterium]